MPPNPFQYTADQLAAAAKRVRRNIILMNSTTGAGHTGADLSEADILVTLYFSVLRYDRALDHPFRDRFILSKGHGAGGFYCTLSEAALIPKELLSTYQAFDSSLQGHPVKQKIKAVEINTGALGHGFPVAVGLALAAKMNRRPGRIFVLLGDGELQEGSNWEAAMSASRFGLDNLMVVVDRNKLQLADRTEHIMGLEPLQAKFEAFGFRVYTADGNDITSLLQCLDTWEATRKDQPSVLLASTVKGKGVSFMEDNPAWHHRIPKGVEVEQALKELE
ncbi:MAG: transketolase [Spirochaetales bacterium]|nr:transketolase [Spirochaetales bacterium]